MDGNLGAKPPPDRASSGQLDGIGGGVGGDSGFVASGPMGGAGGYGDTSSTVPVAVPVCFDQHFGRQVTDQNFVDDPTRSKQASRVYMKKRSRRTASATGNQAAPAAGEDAKSGSAKTAKHGVEERP
ncbi:unnamed protein product [Spirodela intermedia]|uniref:Uncharacterized protein n=1 Tax=Spirodela intermedia TaxID=51605 RepID=A0A7I8KUV7_SPIIN|nr:unnamed protein product [Spirodela intermedia]